jgi:predicted transcriptional regulator
MKQLTIKTGTEADFFSRGREIAKTVDRGETLVESHIISFEDPADMMKLITEGRLALFRAVKEMPGSITEVANRLHRNRSAVKRDIDVLAQAGLLSIAPKILPGHGQKKEVRAVATQIHLQAEVS